ncbi:IS21 family transposase [Catalinimonas niigatensis]|uniref:IS21 family transposase n=1 Tax=Catalinimonas niigatensis TaxID=1397264 RepID=UPI002666141A|nr:IS21 family transposase [Catalinimonas niigatensis]WPP50996.1 IS21 family transposase [Catalinimonas niigatensis]
MANQRIEMRKIKRLFKLYTEGVSKRTISVQLGLSRNTVSKYIDFFGSYQLTAYEVEEMSVEELQTLFLSGQKPKSKRLLTLERYFPYFDRELKKTGVTQHLLWEEYIARHPDGFMLTQFKYWYREWCKQLAPVMHFDHKAGDKLFVDYTGKKLHWVDEYSGEVNEVEVFVSVLGSSQMTYVEASNSQKKEDFISSIENALWFYGGVPRGIVTDNLKSAVTQSSRYEPTLNETFADFAEHYETTILPTRAYKPRDKAIVENTVRIIYNRVFAKIRNTIFYSLTALNQAITELLITHNQMSFRGRDYSRASLFTEVEKDQLRSLPTQRFAMKTYYQGTVHKNGHIYLGKDKHYYSVPFTYIGKKVRIIASQSTVEVYHNQIRIALHRRQGKKYGYTTLEEHMPSSHRFVKKWSSEKFITWAASIGEDCQCYIVKILDTKQHPEQSHKSCLGVLQLEKKVGKERLNNACKRALDYQAYNYKIILRILEKGWDSVEDTSENPPELPPHQNIRGGSYYK